MFDRLKKIPQQVGNLQKAREMQKELSQEMIEVSHKGVILRLSADFSVQRIEIDGKNDDRVKEAFNRGVKEIMKSLMKKRDRLSGLGL